MEICVSIGGIMSDDGGKNSCRTPAPSTSAASLLPYKNKAVERSCMMWALTSSSAALLAAAREENAARCCNGLSINASI